MPLSTTPSRLIGVPLPAHEALVKAGRMKWLLIFLIVVLAAGGFAWWFFSHSGPRQLDMVNNVIPGDSNATLLVQGQVYDQETGLALNIWVPKDRSENLSRL